MTLMAASDIEAHLSSAFGSIISIADGKAQGNAIHIYRLVVLLHKFHSDGAKKNQE